MVSDSLYRDHILQHYKDPHNEGAVDDPDSEAEVANPMCGDELAFTVAVDDGVIQDIRFEGSGCALSIAAASMLTDELQGEPVERIGDVSDDEVFDLVGLDGDDVSPLRVKCILLCRDGVRQLLDEES